MLSVGGRCFFDMRKCLWFLGIGFGGSVALFFFIWGNVVSFAEGVGFVFRIEVFSWGDFIFKGILVSVWRFFWLL